jgi:hypothetical protein
MCTDTFTAHSKQSEQRGISIANFMWANMSTVVQLQYLPHMVYNSKMMNGYKWHKVR